MKIVLRSILSGVLFIILVAMLVRMSMGTNSAPAFSNFLETLANVPQVEIPFITQVDNTIAGSWGIFDGFRLFLNTLIQIINVVIFAINGLLSVIMYVSYFCTWLFFA